MKISIRIDQKAALLQGLELGPRAVIEITKDQAGAHWPAIVESLINLAVTPAESSLPPVATDTVAAFLEMMDQQQAHADAKTAEAKIVSDKALARLRSEVEAREAALREPLRETYEFSVVNRHSSQLSRTSGPRIKSFIREIPAVSCYSRWGFTSDGVLQENMPEWEALRRRADELEAQNRSEIEAANVSALQEQAAVIDAYWAQVDSAEAQRQAEKEHAQQQLLTKRLQSGCWEKDTHAYNRKRYSSPWCAKVTFPDGPKAVYEFGQSSGDRGEAGVMRVPCRAGEIVAWGQKDFRNSNGTTHQLAVMEQDGSMTNVDRVEAYRRFSRREQEIAAATVAAAPVI